MEQHPNFWAVIPASVRYDQTLRPNGKILYAEISALANREGFCFADNAYFSEQFQMTERAIQKLLQQMEELGFIRIETVQKGNQNQPAKRRIWLSQSNPFFDFAGEQKILAGEQKFAGHILNNNIINNTPHTPQGAARRHRDGYKEQPDWKPERFEGFWGYYREHGRGEGKQAAIKAWDKLKPDDALIDTMGRALMQQIQGEEWQRGIGIPHASSWINGRRWEDTPKRAHPEEAPEAHEEERRWI